MDFFFKSRQIITETISRGYDILNKWGKKLKYGLDKLIIHYPLNQAASQIDRTGF